MQYEVVIILILVVALLYYLRINKKGSVNSVVYETKEIINNFDLEELLFLINQHRVELGLIPVESETSLTRISEEHCAYMVSQGKASHDNFPKRASEILELGFENVMEVVAYGYVTNKGLLNAYLRSPSHKKAIEFPKVNFIGISKIKDEKNKCYNVIVLSF